MKGNRQLIMFVAKALAIFALWYVVYDLWLLPDGRLDAWLSHNVAAVSGEIMSLLGYEATVTGRSVRFPGVNGVYIANGCNGLTTVGLFIGFIVAYPGKTSRRLLFIPAGVFAIYLVNVFRIVVMLLAQAHWPAAFDPLHGFGLTTIFYVLVFGLWVLWANYGGEAAKTPATPPPATAA